MANTLKKYIASKGKSTLQLSKDSNIDYYRLKRAENSNKSSLLITLELMIALGEKEFTAEVFEFEKKIILNVKIR